jgi:hypothetical protein
MTTPTGGTEQPIMDALNRRFPLTPRMCGHCGRDGARASANGVPLCHTDDPELPDCYRRVTVYSEPVGALMFLVPLPAGVEGIIR